MAKRVALSAVVFACLVAAQEHVGQYSQADIDRGVRLYTANCAMCHGPNGDAVANVDLRSGRFRRAASDDELARVILAGVPGTAMPPHKLEPADVNGLVAFVRSMRGTRSAAVARGDAVRGRAVYEGKGGCPKCHRVRGEGSRYAPDLTEIGAFRAPDALRQTLLDPDAGMLPVNRPVRAVTRDGKVVAGRRLNEDTFSVQLIDTEDRLVSLMKSELREYTVSKTSTMPSYRDKLTPQELADVVEYLRSLKGIE